MINYTNRTSASSILNMFYPDHPKMKEMTDTAVAVYTSSKHEEDQLMLAMAEFVGDAIISHGTLQTASEIAGESSNIHIKLISKLLRKSN